jgi:hypothetical protein
VTEAEWLSGADPAPMLAFLYGKASDRKLRLFAVACCRRIWHLLADGRSRTAVEVAERYADGLASDEELKNAADAADAVWHGEMERALAEGTWDWGNRAPPYTAAAAAYNAAIDTGWWGAAPAFRTPHEIALEVTGDTGTEAAAQSVLLREIFNPFLSIPANRAWLTPNVTALAATIYDDRAFDIMPVLADALEEAGCTDPDILAHCRGPGPHVRGCWVVDAVLAKT